MAVELKSGDEVKASEEKNADSEEMVVVDIKKDDEKVTTSSNSNSEKVCRICLESSSQATIIALGCDCRGELGFSHHSCAATWFSFRGIIECEICGKTAINIDVQTRLVRERSQVEVEVVHGGYYVSALVISWIMSLILYFICYIILVHARRN